MLSALTHMHGWMLWQGRKEEFLNVRAHTNTHTHVHTPRSREAKCSINVFHTSVLFQQATEGIFFFFLLKREVKKKATTTSVHPNSSNLPAKSWQAHFMARPPKNWAHLASQANGAIRLLYTPAQPSGCFIMFTNKWSHREADGAGKHQVSSCIIRRSFTVRKQR